MPLTYVPAFYESAWTVSAAGKFGEFHTPQLKEEGGEEEEGGGE